VLNYMAYVRGHPNDYNSWANILNDPIWGWDSVQKVFQRMENCVSIKDRVDTDVRGMSGPLSVSIKQPINPIASAFVTAAAHLGYSVGDYNGFSQECASVLQTTTKKGARWSSADAYIWPIISTQKNLHVLLNAEVSRVVFDGAVPKGQEPVAIGVEIYIKSSPRIIRVRKEVILSASAIGSPKLLLLSGVGPCDDLQRLGIPCVINSPQVGRNLTDHILTTVVVNASDAKPKVDIGTVNKHKAENFPRGIIALLQWLFFGTGHLASSTYDTTLFMRTEKGGDLPYPDVQLGELSILKMGIHMQILVFPHAMFCSQVSSCSVMLVYIQC
jgi:choline dehydrogenase